MKKFYLLLPFLFLSFFTNVAMSQSNKKFTFSGKVLSAVNHIPVSGALIQQIPHCSLGTMTNEKGEFSVAFSDSLATFEISSIGLKSKIVKMSGNTTEIIVLEYDPLTWVELNITGYRRMNDRSFRKSSIMVDGAMSYPFVIDNKFISPLKCPLSIVPINYDHTSYQSMCSNIEQNTPVDANSVRSEEYINFFNYQCDTPKSGALVSIQTELNEAPWNQQHKLVRIGLKAKEVDRKEFLPSNLVFLINVSNTMLTPNKLPLIKASINEHLVKQLDENDVVSVVVYSFIPGVVLDSVSGSNKDKIIEKISTLQMGGESDGNYGVELAYQLAEKNFIQGGNNRVILFTDRYFNLDSSSYPSMDALIKEKSEKGISLSVLGFGMRTYSYERIEKLAQDGKGNSLYVNNIEQAKRALSAELAGTTFAIAKDVQLNVEFNPRYVQAYRLLGYENPSSGIEGFSRDAEEGSKMGMGHTVTALYEIIPVGVKSDLSETEDNLKYQNVSHNLILHEDELLTVQLNYKEMGSDKSQLFQTTLKNSNNKLSSASEDFRFSAAVAASAMYFSNSSYLNGFEMEEIIKLAEGAKSYDPEGYRAEFLRLMKMVPKK